jgi:hypothetical protein
MLRELLATSEARNTSLNTGANILNKAIEQARTPPETQLDLVECLRKRRLLDLLAVFTNDKFAKDKTSFAASRRCGVAFLVDCEKYQWHPWMLANEKDQVLWEVRQAFCHLQSWLFFGYIHQAFRILGVPVTQSDFLDPSPKYVSTHKLKTCLARAQKSRSRPAEAELAGLLTDALFILTKYRDHSELGDPMTTRSDGWFIQLLFLSSELNISILALAEEFKMLLRDSIIKPTTGDSIWPTSRTHNGIDMRRFFLSAGWCEDMATRIMRTYSFETSYYLYMLGPPSSHFHHGNCVENVCRRSIIDEKSYVVCHESLTDDGKCDACAQISRENPLLEMSNTPWDPRTFDPASWTQESFLRSTLGLGDTLLMPNQPPFIGTSVPDLGNPFVALSSPAMNLTGALQHLTLRIFFVLITNFLSLSF